MRSVPVYLGLLSLLIVGASAGEARAQKEGSWVGRQVILKAPDAPLKIGDKVVGHGDIFRVYRVDRAEGDWLWLVHTNLSGWALATDVLAFEEATDYFTKVINEDNTAAWPYLTRGACWAARGELDIAIADFNEAIRINADSGSAFAARGFVWERKHDLAKAAADYGEAMRVDPKTAYFPFLRGNVHRKMRKYRGALDDYDTAIRIDPDLADAHANRAWVLATCVDAAFRDGKKAVDAATRACELVGWRTAAYLDILAAACAEDRQFDEAVKREKQALDNLPNDESGTRERYQMHLKLYQKKEPFREEAPDQFPQ